MNSKVTLVVRILLGAFLLLFGVNKFAGFMEFPMEPGDGLTLMMIYATSGFMYLIGALEIIAGLAILVGKFVPVAVTISIAIMFNAVVFHLLHEPGSTMGAALGLILSIVLMFGYKDKFKDYLSA